MSVETILCPKCNRAYTIDRVRFGGKPVRCQSCQFGFAIPELDVPAPPVVSARATSVGLANGDVNASVNQFHKHLVKFANPRILLLILGLAGAGMAMFLIALFIVFSIWIITGDEQSEVADAEEHSVVSDVSVTLPDFSKVNYSVDFSDTDFTRGPKGEELFEQSVAQLVDPPPTDIDEGDAEIPLPTTITGYVDDQGHFQRHGKLTVWFMPPRNGSSGREHLQVNYRQGLLHGIFQSWRGDDGTLLEEKSFVNGKLHGKVTRKHRNGQTSVEAYCVEGQLHGALRTWFEDQVHRTEDFYVAGT